MTSSTHNTFLPTHMQDMSQLKFLPSLSYSSSYPSYDSLHSNGYIDNMMNASALNIYKPSYSSNDSLSNNDGAIAYKSPYSLSNGLYPNISMNTYKSFYPSNDYLHTNNLMDASKEFPLASSIQEQQSNIRLKRSSNNVLESDILADMLSKRPRPDSAGTVDFFPQRPGEKMCAFYMTKRTCSFGKACKFDHPVWVPYGGIPNWKEVTGPTKSPKVSKSVGLPQRKGEPDCSFYMKTGSCKYNLKCKFNHPKDRQAQLAATTPQTQDEATPAMQNGEMARSDAAMTQSDSSSVLVEILPTTETSETLLTTVTTASAGGEGQIVIRQGKGLPLRPDEPDCTYYIKTGSCKYGALCRFNHPELRVTGEKAAPSVVPAQTVPNSAVPDAKQEESTASHPQRPGIQDCSYYLKHGDCSYGAGCKFHHPADRQPSVIAKQAPKLTLAGLPRREGETVCAYYMKTGACKYEATCRFDHPPPGEAAAKAAAEASRIEAASLLDAFDVHKSKGVPTHTAPVWPWLAELQKCGAHLTGAMLTH